MIGTDLNYSISTNLEDLDMDLICEKLSVESYWATGRSHEVIRASFENSHSFGLFHNASGKMVGFCRVISDFATVAYLLDVYILEGYRGKGLGKMLVKEVLSHRKTSRVSRWMLSTRDAHPFYEQFGFELVDNPEYLMGKSIKEQ